MTECEFKLEMSGFPAKAKSEIVMEKERSHSVVPNRHQHSHSPYVVGLMQMQEWGRSRLRLSKRVMKQIHALAITQGLARFAYVSSRILASVCALRDFDFNYAETLFTHMPTPPNVFDFNSIITAYSSHHLHKSFSLLTKMLTTAARPDSRTLTLLINRCASSSSSSSSVTLLQQLHAQSMKLGASSDAYVVSSLVTAYSKHGAIQLARRVFDQSSSNNSSNVVCWTSLVTGYCVCGLVNEARDLFDAIPETLRNGVSYSAMVSGYVRNGCFHEGIQLFQDMMRCARVKPNGSLLVSVLNACAAVGAFELGKWIHSYIDENGFEYELELATALIDFYAKCGVIAAAERVFDRMPVRDVTAWSAMILGLATNGKNQMALELFAKMEKVGPKPNGVAFIAALTACNHKCLSGEVLRLFGLMSEKYGISPVIEHYGCVVDVLARSGRIKEALTFINRMPVQPDGVIWGSLLNGCLMHGYVELGQEVGEYLIQFEPQHSGRYVLLANMYASMGKWEGVSQTRKLMRDRGVPIISAWSFIEIDQTIHKFAVEDGQCCSYPGEIYLVLSHLGKKLEDFSKANDGLFV